MSKTEFEKMRINLWVSGTTDDYNNGGWCSLLQCVVNGNEYTKRIGGYAKATTVTRMTLQGILNALLQLKGDKPVFLHIFTSVVQVSTGMHRNMYKWAKNGWKTTKGEVPQHLDLWQQIHAIVTDSTRIMQYSVHLQNKDNLDQPNRLETIRVSSEYLMKSKKDLYEVQLV